MKNEEPYLPAGSSKIIDVQMGGMKIAHNDRVLRTSGIGSCIAITLYDPIKRIGGMAHPILTVNDSKEVDNPLRFVETVIDVMINALEALGALKTRLEAKIIGGANMFKVFDKNPESIGMQNIEAAKKKLVKEGIEIIANDTGGNAGRSAAFDLGTGLVEVKTKI